MSEQKTTELNNESKKNIKRSPMYPYITYSDAVSKARLINKHERKNSTTANVIYNHLGYQKKTGSSGRVLAALKQYGLLEEKSGQYKISDKAWRLFNLPDESEEKTIIEKDFAMRPRIFREIIAKYPDGLPSDATLKSYLVLEKEFNENSVEHFIRVLKSAIEVAKPFDNGYNQTDESFNSGDEEDRSGGEEAMNGIPNVDKGVSGSGKNPPPLVDGTRVTIDIPSEGEIKISFTGDVNTRTFQFVNGILDLQKKTFPENIQPKVSDKVDSQNDE